MRMTSKEIFDYKKTTLKDALNHPCYAYTRKKSAWYPNKGELDSVSVYFYCSDSPSSVLFACGFDLTEENIKILKENKETPRIGPSQGGNCF